MGEHDIAWLVDVLAELQAGIGTPQDPRELGLSQLQRLGAEIAAVELDAIEGDRATPGLVWN